MPWARRRAFRSREDDQRIACRERRLLMERQKRREHGNRAIGQAELALGFRDGLENLPLVDGLFRFNRPRLLLRSDQASDSVRRPKGVVTNPCCVMVLASIRQKNCARRNGSCPLRTLDSDSRKWDSSVS